MDAAFCALWAYGTVMLLAAVAGLGVR